MAGLAKDFCERPNLYGMTRTSSGQVGGSLDFKSLLGKLVDLGFSGAISHNESRWSGVRQHDAAASLADYTRCKQSTLAMLLKEYRPTGAASLVPAPPTNDGASAYAQLLAERQRNNANIARLTEHLARMDAVISKNREMIPAALKVIQKNTQFISSEQGTAEVRAQLQQDTMDIRDKRSQLILVTQSLEFSRDKFRTTVSQLQQRNDAIAVAMAN